MATDLGNNPRIENLLASPGGVTYKLNGVSTDGDYDLYGTGTMTVNDFLVVSGTLTLLCDEIVLSGEFEQYNSKIVFNSGITNFDSVTYNEEAYGDVAFIGSASLKLNSESISKTLIKATTLTGTITLALDESFPDNGSFSIEATDNQLVINDGTGYTVSSSTSGNVTTYSVERVITTQEVSKLKAGDVYYPIKDETARAGLAGKQDELDTTQMSAVNSGINSTKVGNYDSHIADSTIHVTSTDKTNWNGKVSVSYNDANEEAVFE